MDSVVKFTEDSFGLEIIWEERPNPKIFVFVAMALLFEQVMSEEGVDWNDFLVFYEGYRDEHPAMSSVYDREDE